MKMREGVGQKAAFFSPKKLLREPGGGFGVEEWVGSSVWCSFNEVEGNPGLGLVS